MCAGQRHLAHPADMLDGELAGSLADEADHVDPHLVEEHAMCHKPEDREASQPFVLRPADGLERGTVPLAGAGFHLADDKYAALHGHDVDLAFRASPVAFEYAEAGRLQILRGELFPMSSQSVLGAHRHHLRIPRSRSRCGAAGRESFLWVTQRQNSVLWISGPECQWHMLCLTERSRGAVHHGGHVTPCRPAPAGGRPTRRSRSCCPAIPGRSWLVP